MSGDFPPRPLTEFPVQMSAATRWSDNDMYGHLNNAVYYELFDSAINAWIATHCVTGFTEAPVIGVVAESGCRFHSELAFPGPVTVEFRVAKVGRTSVVYELGVFAGVKPAPCARPHASGRWVHVYVDRHTKQKTPIPAPLRAAMVATT